MMLLDELRKGIRITLHPREETSGRMTIKQALTFYYRLAIIPTVLYVILSLVFNPYQYSAWITATGPMVSTLIIIPIAFFVIAGLYQLFGRLFRIFKNPYSSTFTAFVLGEVPSVLLVWVSPIPILGNIALVTLVWSLIVTIFALSNQQKTSTMAAFGVIVATTIVIAVVGFLILLALVLTGVIPIPAA